MAWFHGGVACPKPARGQGRKARQRSKRQQGEDFRDTVWNRATDAYGDAYCEQCGDGPLLRVADPLHPAAGHVAHNRGRLVAPEDKFNPDAALLKCGRKCHLLGDHGMRF